ncbi:Coenzyme F420 hydrogenase/dehydrogenase, beta subunit C-terminal domain [Sulfuriferula nivalis]|uniref:Coenzyme F420-reducing hydrogenase subunit beta-like protein n=1 Tax=Sulfuriferula nivalis TaxID=2675298 RepID=A0A809RF72_9PROT|nr:Coenzyme F420 hydrogenase/dehydrogenase, beta subunit C-terminal domain [Sulfuriferula nivalis]BBO99523.1 coenzyme F420-reducing hydrogenase subunit beta-like protein [Sulfuriferula nivalis]
MKLKPNSPTDGLIDTITKNGLCTGCGLCESIAPKGQIQVELNASGYLRPRTLETLSSATENKIAEVCPGVTVQHPAGIKGYHPIWGPLVKVRTGFATDPETRKQGSSGGVISALLIHLLESGKIDFVAQIATSQQNPLANELQISRNRADVLRAAGSRYAPSAPLRTLRDLLATSQKFAFVGKPCDVAALRRYSELNKEIKTQIPYMLSFMCAGIPSMKGTYEVLEKLGTDSTKLSSFRYRGDGWPGMARAVQKDGQTFEMDYNTSWGTILNRHLQFRCKICPDGTGEFADIVCADAWYGKDGYPDFTERDGRSLLLSRTDTGETLIADALANNTIQINNLEIDEIAKMQPYQVQRKQVALARTLATRFALGIAPTYRNLSLLRASTSAAPMNFIRNAIGTYRRANGEVQ